ncbi:MAG TPA: glycosyltransferase family 39 protein [Bacteroidia bacterium]|nr:glycosyltransferase family 39 protein [Bacteroidia bacterium]
MTNKKIVFFFLLPVLISFILHFRVFSFDVIGYHAWRQSQTQTVIYNFTFSDTNILHPQKFDLSTGSSDLLYEFPLYQWCIAQVNNVLGYSVMHTRVITFIIFIFLLLGFYRLLIKFVSIEVALVSNALLCFSPLLYYYCVNPLPDILALTCAVWALNFFMAFVSSAKSFHFLLFGLFLMASALVKLPFIIFGSPFLLYIYRAYKDGYIQKVFSKTLLLLFLMVPVALWYTMAIPTWRDKGVVVGLSHNNKTLLHLLDCFQFNLISSVPELLTNYASCIFLVVGMVLFFKNKQLKKKHGYFVVLFIAASAYFLFELNMIEKAHDYYLMPFIPLIFLVVALGVKHLYTSGKYRRLVFFVACVVPLTAWLRIDQRWNPDSPGFVTDYLTEQSALQSLIPRDEKCIIDADDSHFIALYYLKRQGYSLFDKEINPLVLKDRYSKGARFLVTENLSLNLNDYPEFDFETLYSKKLKIYKLSLKNLAF